MINIRKNYPEQFNIFYLSTLETQEWIYLPNVSKQTHLPRKTYHSVLYYCTSMTYWDILPLWIIKAFHLTPPPRGTTNRYLLTGVVYLHQPCFTDSVYADDTFVTILWIYPRGRLFKGCLKCSSSWNDCRETITLHIPLQQSFVTQQDANSKNNPLHSRSLKIVIFLLSE